MDFMSYDDFKKDKYVYIHFKKAYGLFHGQQNCVAVFTNLPDARFIAKHSKDRNNVHIFRVDYKGNKIGKELKII